MNALTTVTKTTSPMVVVNVLSEVSNICGRIAEYHVATSRINFERNKCTAKLIFACKKLLTNIMLTWRKKSVK